MTTYNTGNPIGSTSPKDLYDNAENFDDAVNGTNPTWVDRFGNTRVTMFGAEENATAIVAAATIQADRAESEADDAENSANIASAAVSGSVNTFFTATKAAGDALAAGLGDGATVIVDRDEDAGVVQTRRVVTSGVLGAPVNKLDAGQVGGAVIIATSVDNMIAGKPAGWASASDTVPLSDGQRWQTGATTWVINSSDGVDVGGGLFARSVTPRNAIDYGLSRWNTQGLIDAQDGSGDVTYSQYGSLHMANGIDSQSVFDFANFADQGQSGANAIGFVFHHYTDGTMVQMDNVGEDNVLLYLKNANNSLRRADQPSDFIGSAKFLQCGRNESDGLGGVTATRLGFYISKDFELVWPMQATGVNTARLWNNVGANSLFWSHEFKNSNEQQYLFRVDNDGTNPISVEWSSVASTTQVNAHKSMQLKAVDGILYLTASETIRSQVPHRLQNYATGTLPTLSAGDVGCMAYMNEGGNKYPIHWDGSAWKKVSDNSAV